MQLKSGPSGLNNGTLTFHTLSFYYHCNIETVCHTLDLHGLLPFRRAPDTGDVSHSLVPACSTSPRHEVTAAKQHHEVWKISQVSVIQWLKKKRSKSFLVQGPTFSKALLQLSPLHLISTRNTKFQQKSPRGYRVRQSVAHNAFWRRALQASLWVHPLITM